MSRAKYGHPQRHIRLMQLESRVHEGRKGAGIGDRMRHWGTWEAKLRILGYFKQAIERDKAFFNFF